MVANYFNLPRYKSFEMVRRRFRRSLMSSDDERLWLCRFMVARLTVQQEKKNIDTLTHTHALDNSIVV